MQGASKQRIFQWLAGLFVVGYMGAIAYAAHASGVSLLLFPELAALSFDVMTRPRGRWASQPGLIVLTPILTAIVGLFITRHLPYGAMAILIIVMASLLLIKLLRSSVSPAISAGVLPMVLGEKHWMYPAAILVGLSGLVLMLWLWQRFGPVVSALHGEEAEASEMIDELEATPVDRYWLVTLLGFVLILASVSEITGLRFILFPPLIVMAYEIFGHPEVPHWMARPGLFPLVCFLTASVGLGMEHLFAGSFVGVVLATLGSIVVLRAFQVHMPPALAVGLLPFVMSSPDYRYPLSVAMGTVALTLSFVGRGYMPQWFAFGFSKLRPGSRPPGRYGRES